MNDGVREESLLFEAKLFHAQTRQVRRIPAHSEPWQQAFLVTNNKEQLVKKIFQPGKKKLLQY